MRWVRVAVGHGGMMAQRVWLRRQEQDGCRYRRHEPQLCLALLALAVEGLLALLLLRRKDVLEQRTADGRHVDDLRNAHTSYR